MAEVCTVVEDCRTKFQYLASKFTSLIHGRSEGDRQQLNLLFDELNSLDFKSSLINNSDKAVLIINQCCSIVPTNDTFLVAKGCQLISKLITKQHVKVEGKTLAMAVTWCTESLKCCADVAILDILLALESLLHGNGTNVEEQLHDLVGTNGILIKLLYHDNELRKKGEEVTLSSPWEVQLMTVRCLEALTFNPDTKAENLQIQELNKFYLESCAQVFLKQLCTEKHSQQDELLYCKVLITCMRGLQNVLQQSAELLSQLLGEALGIVKTYMLYGLQGYTGLRPQQVFPANIFQGDIRQTAAREGRGGKNVRMRKRNLQRQKKSDSSSNRNEDGVGHGNYGITQSFSSYTLTDSANSVVLGESSLGATVYPGWLKTSDSDFSDTETGQAAKVKFMQGRVRQSTLLLLFVITKMCERKIFFGYWTSLLPVGPNIPQIPTLCTSLLKDSSPRNRMLVLQVLTLMLIGSRLYLSQAENSSRSSVSFTPFSVTLGNMVRELHHSLCLALAIENSIPVITQLLKCLAALVQNTPYHRLEPGLITKLVSYVRPYLRHKDASIQVGSLTVFGSVVAVDPGTPEIVDIITKCSLPSWKQKVSDNKCDTTSTSNSENETVALDAGQKHDSNQDSDYDDFLEDEPDALLESCSEGTSDHMSWLLEVCLKNLSQPDMNEGKRAVLPAGVVFCSAPVRVESLQVLTVLARNYFTQVVSRHLGPLLQMFGQTLCDSDVAICLHSGRVIDAIGSSMQQCLQEQSGTNVLSLDTSLQFWQAVLAGPLISLIQNTEQPTLRAVGCDCLATIGTETFEQLPHNKQNLIITLLFGCSHDEENAVRASAIRALAVCVLFPTLREDIHFVTDTAESVIRTIQDDSLLVRIKASWSLGNLSDALVLNSLADNIEDIPRNLLLKLMETSNKAAQDSDKVRCNAVRAVGNFIRLVTEDMTKTNFKDCTEKAISVLVQNATTGNNMKVRWNACYGIGNMMKNSALYSETSAWQETVFSALSKLVQDVRNFKVRINAALALSVPSNRQQYGIFYTAIWQALLNGLDNSQNMEDFSEYKHRDNLLDQICLTLSHLASVATRDDLIPLQDVLSFHLDTLQQHLLKFHERVIPERAGAISAAASHAASLLQLPGLSSNQHSAAALLTSIFLQDIIDLPLT